MYFSKVCFIKSKRYRTSLTVVVTYMFLKDCQVYTLVDVFWEIKLWKADLINKVLHEMHCINGIFKPIVDGNFSY